MQWSVLLLTLKGASINGKTIRIIVGLAPGGGYDLYSRVIGRHLGKHIPGNPTVVVENMAKAIFDLEPALIGKLKQLLK